MDRFDVTDLEEGTEYIQMALGRYRLKRLVPDDEFGQHGDQGHNLHSYREEGRTDNGILVLNGVIECGSNNHWWRTTRVTKFLNICPDRKCVRFKTANSTYVAESF